MLAYRVTEHDEEAAVIRFAVSNAQARREGAARLNSEWEGVTCERAPEFDQYATQGYVAPMQYLEHGWWWECFTCSRWVGLDLADDLNSEIAQGLADPEERPMDPQEHEGHIYCSAECWQVALAPAVAGAGGDS